MIKLNDLAIDDSIKLEKILLAFEKVLKSGQVLLGPECDLFESKAAELTGKRFGVGVSSGSDALFLALKALGVGAGDEIITTSISWIATNNAIARTGATPINIDVDETHNLCLVDVERNITKRTKAIVPVHFTGVVVEQRMLRDVSRRTGVPIVEDAAQAFAAKDCNGEMAGSAGTLVAYSMNALKPFRSFGEAGLVTTDSPELDNRLRSLRYNGMINREICSEVSINGRLDTLQAAALLVNMDDIPSIYLKRSTNAKYYRDALRNRFEFQPEETVKECRAYHTFPILVNQRDELRAYLHENGVETGIHHRITLQAHPAFSSYKRCETPRANSIVNRLLSLPIHEKLSKNQIMYVCEQIVRSGFN
jgi:dTDP-4-amino-4,6-dideoxygalactose transaminase